MVPASRAASTAMRSVGAETCAAPAFVASAVTLWKHRIDPGPIGLTRLYARVNGRDNRVRARAGPHPLSLGDISLRHVLHRVHHATNDRIPREMTFGASAAGCPHAASQPRIAEKTDEAIRERPIVADRYGVARQTITDHFGHGPRTRTDAGQAEVHRLEEHDPKWLEPRREAKHVGGRVSVEKRSTMVRAILVEKAEAFQTVLAEVQAFRSNDDESCRRDSLAHEAKRGK
jgi:hypothetical protein